MGERQALTDAMVRPLVLREAAGLQFEPNAHVMLHLFEGIGRIGNPFHAGTWVGEGLNRDMVKVGATFLGEGRYQGKQLVPAAWIERCKVPYANNVGIDIPGHASGEHGYAYGWWLKTYPRPAGAIELYSALGWGGQEIMVLPQLNTTVVFTGGNYTANVEVFEILEQYILPAIIPGS